MNTFFNLTILLQTYIYSFRTKVPKNPTSLSVHTNLDEDPLYPLCETDNPEILPEHQIISRIFVISSLLFKFDNVDIPEFSNYFQQFNWPEAVIYLESILSYTFSSLDIEIDPSFLISIEQNFLEFDLDNVFNFLSTEAFPSSPDSENRTSSTVQKLIESNIQIQNFIESLFEVTFTIFKDKDSLKNFASVLSVFLAKIEDNNEIKAVTLFVKNLKKNIQPIAVFSIPEDVVIEGEGKEVSVWRVREYLKRLKKYMASKFKKYNKLMLGVSIAIQKDNNDDEKNEIALDSIELEAFGTIKDFILKAYYEENEFFQRFINNFEAYKTSNFQEGDNEISSVCFSVLILNTLKGFDLMIFNFFNNKDDLQDRLYISFMNRIVEKSSFLSKSEMKTLFKYFNAFLSIFLVVPLDFMALVIFEGRTTNMVTLFFMYLKSILLRTFF